VVNDVDRDQQESARSQVLRNEDLLGLIMELMEEPPPAIVLMNIQKPNRRYFLWASLACKAFFGPAMNILWHSIFSLEVIIKLIPTLEKDEHNCYVGYYNQQIIHVLLTLHFFLRVYRI